MHCYVNKPAGNREIHRRELSLARWQDILDQMAQAGVLWLQITGGEPLLRPDFAEFYLYAKRRGFHITLFTNGTLLTPELADLLAEYPPWQIEITLYGATASTYEHITGVPGSYAHCLRAIDMILPRDLTLKLKTMALTLNVHEIDAMQRMAREWGVDFRCDPLVHSRLDGNSRPLAYRLSPEEILALQWQDIELVQRWQEFCAVPWVTPDRERLFSCGAGLNTFHIDAYGSLYPCLMVRWLRYDLRDGLLEEALGNFLPTVRQLPVTHNRTCWECELRVFCQNCPAWSYQEMGDSESPDPFRCRLTHLRSQALGLNMHVALATTVNQEDLNECDS